MELCRVLGLLALMWGASEARTVDLGQTQGASNVICDSCLDFSFEAQAILSDPEIQRQAVDLISQTACQALTPKLKTKCSDLVSVYVLDAFAVLQTYLGPDFCTEIGLCMSESVKYINPRGKLLAQTERANGRTCALCEEFAKDALPYLAANTTALKMIEALHRACARLGDSSKQCQIMVDIFAADLMERLDDISPEELCQITHFCTPTSKPALTSRGLKINDCAICQFVVLEVKLKLKDPVTQERILEVLLNGCNRVQNHVDECKMIVTQYAPFILANLDTILDADALCSKIRACQANTLSAVGSVLLLPSDGRAHGHVHAL